MNIEAPRRLRWLLPCLLVVAAVFAPRLSRADLSENDFRQWGLLAIQDDGRIKPLDTFAHESLLRLTGGSFMGMDIYKDATGKIWHPNDFLLNVLTNDAHDWKKEPLVLVNYRPLVEQLGLDHTRKRFSYEELTKLPALETMAREVHTIRLRDREPQLTRAQQEVESVSGRLTLLSHLLSGEALLIVPRPDGAAPTGATNDNPTGANNSADAPNVSPSVAGLNFASKTAWLLPPDANNAYGETRFAPVTQHLRETVGAYREGNAYQFNLHARELRGELRTLNPARYPADDKLDLEYTYNHLSAFSWASFLYGAGAVLLIASGFGGVLKMNANPWRALRWAGLAVGLAGVVLHGTGIGMRCFIAGRPPVTNMYEVMVWVSFVVTALGFAFYARYRGTTYLLAALPLGCLVLLLVQQLPVAFSGSIEPLQPVLRDNFWLTVHVLTETASYGAFALGMAFGHILLWRYIVNPAEARVDHVLHFWLYRVLQLGVLLITVGTILGAVWANYSWGRFWGWDPKETWAFITLLCYIVAIHGRIAGWWGQFGMAVASVVCFAAVVMASYGVNYVLGKGLHSYGRGVGGEGYVVAFLVFEAAYLTAACVRHRQTLGTPRGPRPPGAATTLPPVGEPANG